MKGSQVPRGATKRSVCRCGRYYWDYCEGASTTPRGACTVCKIPMSKKEQA